MLANLLRPRTLRQVLGQKKVVDSLNNAFLKNEVPNCICLCGSSGCGKNTTANIVAATLNCHNPKIVTDENGKQWVEPCLECPSCKDIVEERFGRDVHVYSGQNVTSDVLREEIESVVEYASNDENCIIMINEAQLVPSLKRLLETVETPRPNVYWILTSTDTAKFNQKYSKDNKVQEGMAMRSRFSMYNILPATDQDLFEIACQIEAKFEEEHPDVAEQIPEDFADTLMFVVKNSNHNFRQLINDTANILNAEAWTKQDVIDLLGYTDEEKETQMVANLCAKMPSALSYIQSLQDVEGFANYARAIISDYLFRKISGIPYDQKWKEDAFLSMDRTGNLLALGEAFNRLASYPYFNASVFKTILAGYYMGVKETNLTPQATPALTNPQPESVPVRTATRVPTRTPIHG